MDSTDKVLDRALLFLSGEISDSGKERLALLCRLAVSELEARLRSGAQAESIGEQFVSAAGVLALSMYAALGDEPFAAVKIGSVSMTKQEGDLSGRLRTLSEELLAGFLRERGFDFRGVCG